MAKVRARWSGAQAGAPGWLLTEEALRAAIGPKTRAILINSPHNPAGGSSAARAEALAKVVRARHRGDLRRIYEHLVFDGAVHIPFATLPGMRNAPCVSFGGQDNSRSPAEGGLGDGPRELVSV